MNCDGQRFYSEMGTLAPTIIHFDMRMGRALPDSKRVCARSRAYKTLAAPGIPATPAAPYHNFHPYIDQLASSGLVTAGSDSASRQT